MVQKVSKLIIKRFKTFLELKKRFPNEKVSELAVRMGLHTQLVSNLSVLYKICIRAGYSFDNLEESLNKASMHKLSDFDIVPDEIECELETFTPSESGVTELEPKLPITQLMVGDFVKVDDIFENLKVVAIDSTNGYFRAVDRHNKIYTLYQTTFTPANITDLTLSSLYAQISANEWKVSSKLIVKRVGAKYFISDIPIVYLHQIQNIINSLKL